MRQLCIFLQFRRYSLYFLFNLLCHPSTLLLVLGQCVCSSNTVHKMSENCPTNQVSSNYFINPYRKIQVYINARVKIHSDPKLLGEDVTSNIENQQNVYSEFLTDYLIRILIRYTTCLACLIF